MLYIISPYEQLIGLHSYLLQSMHVETACIPVRIISFQLRFC
jgi:hypothetical protein